MTDEVEVELCCDALSDAIDGGGIHILEVSPGKLGEVIPDENGETAIQINFCPFCGQKRRDFDAPGEVDAKK